MRVDLGDDTLDLSVAIPSKDEALNLDQLLPGLIDALRGLGASHEILVVDAASPDATRRVCEEHGVRYVCEPEPGYGRAVLRGLREARGRYVITMDADLSHPARFIRDLWTARETADVAVASRYVPGGRADQPAFRLFLSRVLNLAFRHGLSIGVHDASSGFRLYRKDALRGIGIEFGNFVFLVEILLKAHQRGSRIAEVPFHYQPRGQGRSHAQIAQFGIDYLRLFFRMWRLRNSIDFPDYDWRAHDSRIPLQRYWQRRRFAIVMGFTPPGVSTLDVGCGSSRILAALPHAIGVDLRREKLVFMRRTNARLAQADGMRLPFASEQFGCVICSQVIEHIPDENGRLLDELERVLKPGGTLVIGTPDYGNWEWRVTEFFYGLAVPGAYAHEHVTHYTYIDLKEALVRRGFFVKEHAYILRGELVFKAEKRRSLIGG